MSSAVLLMASPRVERGVLPAHRASAQVGKSGEWGKEMPVASWLGRSCHGVFITVNSPGRAHVSKSTVHSRFCVWCMAFLSGG